MRVNLKLSRVGMSMDEATIVKWRFQPGQPFKKGEVLYEIETEKVTQEIEAPCNGQLVEIRIAEGENAEVGQVVCVIDQAVAR